MTTDADSVPIPIYSAGSRKLPPG